MPHRSDTCQWFQQLVGDEHLWDTSCSDLTVGFPNLFSYCPYCGRSLELVYLDPEPEPPDPERPKSLA